MMFDLGLDPSEMDDAEAVRGRISELESQFDLVMLVDRFEESMVLLRHLLCWDLAEVAYVKSNAQSDGRKSDISQEARGKLREWLAADQALYDHFAER